MTPLERSKIDQIAVSVAERWSIANWAFYSAHRRVGFDDSNAMYLTEANMTNLQMLASGQRPEE